MSSKKEDSNQQTFKSEPYPVWHPFSPLKGGFEVLPVNRGKGLYLELEDGRWIMDAISSWWVNLHGHAREEIAEAISQQARQLEQVIFAGFSHRPAIEISQKLISILPPGYSKIFFSDNGSTAVEVAMKMAIQYFVNQGEERKTLVAFEGAYHGDTFGSMAVGARGEFNIPFEPYLFDVKFIPLPTEGKEEESLAAFRELCKQDSIAAFIFEPLIQGAGGMRMYSPLALDSLVKEAHQAGALCIADEVMTGFGRTGKLFASDYLNEKPDIMCLSKGITGGFLPLGVTAVHQKVVSAFDTEQSDKTFYHGHSYTANPLACAAACASFDLLLSSSCQEKIKRISEDQKAFANKMKGKPGIHRAQSQGTIAAIELDSGKDQGYFSSLRNKIYPHFLKKGILLRPLGNVIYLMPPYIIEPEELEAIHQRVEHFVELQFSS